MPGKKLRRVTITREYIYTEDADPSRVVSGEFGKAVPKGAWMSAQEVANYKGVSLSTVNKYKKQLGARIKTEGKKNTYEYERAVVERTGPLGKKETP